MNVTKFGAFVNILPGRDGLLHISKIGGGKRIDKVEDVLDLGDEIEVRVDDVDPNGKVSLSPGLRSRGGRGRVLGVVRRPSDRAVSRGDRGGDAPARGPAPPRPTTAPTASTSRSRTPSTARSPPSSATSVPAGADRGGESRGGGGGARPWRPRRWRPSPLTRSVPTLAAGSALTDPGIERSELASGVRVVTERMPEARSVSGRHAGSRVGSRDEPEPVAGASHFLEHLLFKGTERALGPLASPWRSTPSAAR